MSVKKYKWVGNRDPNNRTEVLNVHGVNYSPGDDVPMAAALRDELAAYFVFEDADGEDVGEGLTSPTLTPLQPVADPDPTSVSGTTISESDEAGKSADK